MSPDMKKFIEFIINTVDSENIHGKKGWLNHFNNYEWPRGNKGCEKGISDRQYFNSTINKALNSKEIDSEMRLKSVYNDIAKWGIVPQVSDQFAQDISSTLNYLKSVKNNDKINCDSICGNRIATSSKIYYFSNPCYWTIYDSRVSYAFNQLAYLFNKNSPELYKKLEGMIEFPVPENRGNRFSFFPNKYSEQKYSLWFVRASLIMREIAKYLNENGYEKPCKQIGSTEGWNTYHIEMVFFMLGYQTFITR